MNHPEDVVTAKQDATATVNTFTDGVGRLAVALHDKTGCSVERGVDLAYAYLTNSLMNETPELAEKIARAADYVFNNKA